MAGEKKLTILKIIICSFFVQLKIDSLASFMQLHEECTQLQKVDCASRNIVVSKQERRCLKTILKEKNPTASDIKYITSCLESISYQASPQFYSAFRESCKINR